MPIRVKYEPVAWSVVDPKLGNRAFNRAPISQISGLDPAQTGNDPDLGALVRQAVKPGNEFLGLTDREHGRALYPIGY